MNRLHRLVSVTILMCVLVGVFVSCDNFDQSLLKEEFEQLSETSAVDEQESVTKAEKESVTKAKTENPYSMSKVVSISLDRYSGKGMCTIYWGERHGSQSGKSLLGAQRFLYRTKKSKVYKEISVSMIGSADGKGISIDEDDELLHLIVVFKKDYKLTEKDKTVLEKTGIDYMFEN